LSGHFPLWEPTGPDGTGEPVLPPWYVDALRREGGSYDAVTVRAPKRRHGRDELRMVWTLADPHVLRGAGLHGTVGAPWPWLQQVARVERRRTVHRRGHAHESVEVTYAITSLSPARARARPLLDHLRQHWGIENKLHWVRDVTFDEDRSQTRTGAAPQVMAACRNLALALLRRVGHINIAAALRTNAGRPAAAVALVLSTGFT
jgi:predicted transposase YbfD/YdcC